MEGINMYTKGYNEYVLYGYIYSGDGITIDAPFYYLYTAMSWDDGSENVIDEDDAGKGLFMRNYIDDSLEGWWCERNSLSYFNWLCYSARIEQFYFEPESEMMPINRVENSWWECGAEDMKTYTQASCRQQMVIESEQKEYNRIRYDDETNLEFWGLSFQHGEFKWVNGGKRSLAGAHSPLLNHSAVAFALALSTYLFSFA
jgi:hypothetical protein